MPRVTGIEEGVAIGSLVVGAIGAATSVAGGIMNANAQAKQAAYAAQVARNNATIANQNAQASIQAGQAESERVGLQNRAKLASLVAAQAASGEDVNSGSNLDVRISEKATGMEDRATAEHNAFMKAYGYETQAAGYTTQAGIDTATAANATALEPVNAAAGTLAGASAIGTKYTQFVQSGALGGGSGNNTDPAGIYD